MTQDEERQHGSRGAAWRARVGQWARRLPRSLPAFVGITAAGLALRAAIPPVIRWNSPHDDEVLMRIAASIMDGEWLGTWGTQPLPHATLAKGPGYPLFLVATHWTELSPPLAAYVIYLIGAVLLTVSLRAHVGRRWSVGLYALLAFNPIVFSIAYSQVYRDQLVTALSLLALGLGVHLATRYARPGAWPRTHAVTTVALTLLLGMVFGWLVITRADSVWTMVATAGALAVVVLPTARRFDHRAWLRLAAGGAAVGALAVGTPFGIALVNDHYYSVRLSDDYSQGAFAEALAVWSSVEIEGSDPSQVVSVEQREAVYAISPAARRVAGSLEDPESVWIERNCTWHEDVDVVCDDYGSYFTWALRDAAYNSAEARSAVQFQEYFRAITEEIEAACRSGALTCGMRGFSPDIPPLDQVPVRSWFANLAGYVTGSLTFHAGAPFQKIAAPDDDGVDLWISTVNGADNALALVEDGNHPSIMAQANAVTLLESLYTWFATPMLAAAAFGLFARRLWASLLGRLAIAVLAGWGANLAIVSLFYAGTDRAAGSTGIPLYTMGSQSYLIVGLTLIAAVMLRGLPQRLRHRDPPVASDDDNPDPPVQPSGAHAA